MSQASNDRPETLPQEPMGDGPAIQVRQECKDAKLFSALVAAQSELQNPAFDATNPFLKNRYATLRAHLDAVRPVLNKHGISISQGIIGQGNAVGVITRLIHKDGGMMTDVITTTLEKPSGQSIGALTTYLRRYALAAICGVVGEDDDDGERDMRNRNERTKPEAPEPEPKKPEPLKVGALRERVVKVSSFAEVKPGVWRFLTGGDDAFTDNPDVKETIAKHAAEQTSVKLTEIYNGKGWCIQAADEPKDQEWKP